jgi:GNAT superfamily N-acetyltransferase
MERNMISYRLATIDDIDELVRLRIDFLHEFQPDACGQKDECGDYLKEYFASSIPCDEFVAWLAEKDGRIIGTSGLSFYTIAPSLKNLTGKIAYILNMYTIPSFRGKGIASALFERIVGEARKRGYKKILLHASESGRLVYQKFGFKSTDNEMAITLE